MKKILIALPVIFCLILSVCVPLSTFALYDVSELNFYSLEDFQKDYPLEEYDRYFYFYGQSDTSYTNTFSYYAPFNEQEASIEESSDFIKITFSDEQDLLRNVYSYGFFESGYYHFDYSSIVYYPDSESIYFYDNINNLVIYYDSTLARPLGLETNLKQASSLPDVYVEFIPDLNGIVSRDILINGNAGKLSSISMFIENRSSFNIQYKVEINKANQSNSRWDYESPDNYSRDNLSSSFDDDPVFVYYSNQQVYSHVKTDNNIPGFGYHSPTSLYTKASYFHKLDKGQSETVSFPLSMINLSENVDYRVIVTAYKLDYQYVTEATYPLDPDNVDKSNFEYDSSIFLVAYDSVFRFSDLSGVKYNPDQTSGNILSYDGSNGISDQKKYHVNYDAVIDLETGETKIGHVDNFNSDDYWNSIGVPFQDKYNTFTESFDSSLDLSSFSSLFSPVFGAVGMFFNFLPPSISMIFIFGFATLIVIAIIKAVKS